MRRKVYQWRIKDSAQWVHVQGNTSW